MTLVELHVDVARVADALERIAFLLEKLVYPPPAADVKVTQATLDDLHIVTPEDTERMREEQMRFAQIHKAVPGSEAYADKLFAWEDDMRRAHGEEWQAPDWAEVLISAAGGGRAVREQAHAAGPAGRDRQAEDVETGTRQL